MVLAEGPVVCASVAPFLCAPGGPDHPFGTPYVAFLDSLRVLCWVGGLILICTLPWFMAKATTIGQRVRFLGTALYAITVVGTELVHLGDYANYRLFVNLTAVIVSLYGLWEFLKRDRYRVEML